MLSDPPAPDEPITVVCAATYLADRIPAYAFVFRVPSTATRFTIYAANGGQYHINDQYALTLTPVEAGQPATPTAPPSGDPTPADPPAEPNLS